ncbi:MAG TPA: nucleotide sugar dehydrogenase [Trueperaceae bacterium]|nr:nucleotide sugar dehydrogenase [Trueperaceae bacterium]
METATTSRHAQAPATDAPVKERIAVVGQGYVGLPVTLALARAFPGTVGFDVDRAKVARLAAREDATGETSPEDLASAPVRFTADEADLKGATFFVVAVPTPITADRRPDLSFLRAASETVGRALSPGAVVVYESTVYPGVTEEECGPVLERVSGLRRGVDFKLGYSPERINPGDKEHTLDKVVKVVAGEDEATLERVAAVYERIVPAGVHRAKSIKVAEAAKVIENTQRDLNIALMNELAMIFDRLGIDTVDVLEAAGTKWNFLPFRPGLVGGHCIGVDPYYLTAKAEEVGYAPHVILAGRRINDGMGAFVAQKAVRMLAAGDKPLKENRVGVLGLTFKENVPDLRNSRVPDIVAELASYGIRALVHDPLASAEEARQEYGIELQPLSALTDLDALVLAVPHRELLTVAAQPARLLRPGGALLDVKAALRGLDLGDVLYWSL